MRPQRRIAVRSSRQTPATSRNPPAGSPKFQPPRRLPTGRSAVGKQPSSLCHCIINAMDLKFDLVIIGGGIVGLATALEAVRTFRDRRIAVLEKENRSEEHTSELQSHS